MSPAENDFWRSLSDLGEESPEYLELLAREFPEQAGLLADPPSRRTFMQLMGASLALAGITTGCRKPEERIVPMSRTPEGTIPGVPRYFASSMELSGNAIGLQVTSYDGRPIKIEGNPAHPFTGSRSTSFAQASILGLYDPDRSDSLVRRAHGLGVPSAWGDFAKFLTGRAGRDARVRVLSEPTASPTVQRFRRLLSGRFSAFRWHEWEPLSRDNEREGMRLAFGAPLRPLMHFDRADIVLSLDGDFLVDHPASLRYSLDFASRRRPEQGSMSRLYAVESTMSHTGAMADHRLPLRSESMLAFLLGLEARITGQGEGPALTGKAAAFLDALAEDIAGSRKSALVTVGARQPPIVHAVAARINSASEAIEYLSEPPAPGDADRKPHAVDLAELVTDIHAGEVDVLLIVGGNPVYDAPADLYFARALAKVPTSIHLSEYQDETSSLCSWHLPRAHYLEAWGDSRSWDGTYTIAQPLIEPLRNGRSAIQVLAMLADPKGNEAAADGAKLVRETLGAGFAPGPAGDSGWRKAVHDGFLPDKGYPNAGRPAVGALQIPADGGSSAAAADKKNGELEIVFTSSHHTYDGRFANNAWLQEIPSFTTKLTWDNAALIGPSTARRLGIRHGDMISISLPVLPPPAGGGESGDPKWQPRPRAVEVPAYVMPGQAPHSIALALGHGRTRAGLVGGMARRTYDWDGDSWNAALDHKTPGFDVYPLRVSQSLYVETSATVKRTGGSYPLATTQDHWQIDDRGQKEIQKRIPELVKSVTPEDLDVPGFSLVVHHVEPGSIFDRQPVLTEKTKGRRWAMATDLSTCIGCNACVVACQAENNIPVVGKDQVIVNREMHWIRIDRYFKGDPDDPVSVAYQPVACQQCENAPCEEVCPVGATVHSDEGLNDMAYNRCVGTRYCINNCPYKVRRFNFFNWHKRTEDQDPREARNQIRRLLFNPEVTVRSRGVVEKCTFCVQRIERAKIATRNESIQTGRPRPIQDGEVVTACAQACPTDAIIFGDLADPESRVSKLHRLKRAYPLLHELNTFPRNAYLARAMNPNPKLTKEPRRSKAAPASGTETSGGGRVPLKSGE